MYEAATGVRDAREARASKERRACLVGPGCSVNTTYFWPDLHRGMAELARVLRPGGRLVLGFGSDEALRRAGYEERGFTLHTAAQIEDALRASGFAPSALQRLDREGPRGAFFVSRSERMGTGER